METQVAEVEEKKTYYQHGVLGDGTRFTVAGEFDDDNATLNMGCAICSDEDQFSKETGRIRATGRIQSSGKGRAGIPLYKKTPEAPEEIEYWKTNSAKVFLSFVRSYLEGVESADDLKTRFNFKLYLE